ncbi:MAG: DUF359 domain-containing protein [Candidatus Thermoplasmatota archaeon]
MYFLPDALRDKLKEPIGCLVDEPTLISRVKNTPYLVSIGDKVTYTVLSYDIQPCLAIVDFILERQPYPAAMKMKIQTFTNNHIKVKNPAGMITEELWNAIDSFYLTMKTGKPLLIEVDGEEDLASLAAIYLAPRDVTIIYGLPNKGVLIVTPSKINKKKVEDVLKIMRDAYGNRDSIKKC